MQKKVSIVVPCYNAARWLPQCFLSLAGQTMGIENLELIFVDDASTDGGETWGLLLEFERAYPDSVIAIQLEENKRQGGARNEALRYASGEYLAFVDADDWVEPMMCERAYGEAKKRDADIVQFSHRTHVDGVGTLDVPDAFDDRAYRISSIDERKKLLVSEKITYGCWNKLYRTEMVKRAGVAFAENVVYEEPLFVYPLLFYANRFVTMAERLYIYRRNPGGTMHRDMESVETLMQHANVQKTAWEFMKGTEFFGAYYEEIKLYFLHSFYYETLFFAARRGLRLSEEQCIQLGETALREVPDMDESRYADLIPMQMRLYRMTRDGTLRESIGGYLGELAGA